MLRINLLVLSVCLFDNSVAMKGSRQREKMSGKVWHFKQFEASILPMSPYRGREINCSQQTRAEEVVGGRGESRMGTRARAWSAGEESIPKGFSSFIPKIELSIAIQPTTLQD